VSIDRDLERSGLELGPSGRGRSQSGKDLGEVEVSEWWKAVGWKGFGEG